MRVYLGAQAKEGLKSMFIEHLLCACMLSGQPALPSEITVAVTLAGEKRELGGHRSTKDIAEFALGQSKTSYLPPLTLEPIHLSTIVCLFPRQIPARRLPIYAGAGDTVET